MSKASKNGGSDLVLHYFPQSFYSQKVLMALYQKKLKFRTSVVDIRRGRQFSDKFLALNPNGEVPVLVDNEVRIIPGSDKIITYLDDNFSNGSPRLQPSDPDLKSRTEELYDAIHSLNVEAVTFGSVMFDDLSVNPKPPYENPAHRSQMKSFADHRESIIRTELVKHPQYTETWNGKLEQIRNNAEIYADRKKYERLLLTFEELMDQCEAELSTHEDQRWWLCSPDISIADVSFSILLNRLWQLGFERRMWERNRPSVTRYFARVQQLQSFKKAITVTSGAGLRDIFESPTFWIFVGVVAVGGGFYLWNKHQTSPGGLLGIKNVPPRTPFSASSAPLAPYGYIPSGAPAGISRDTFAYSQSAASNGSRSSGFR